jgi:predicted cytidylate kinase
MIVTISGPPGSGKTTVGRIVARSLACPFKSTGEEFRKMAEERGVSLAKLGELAEADHSIDLELDRRIVASLSDPQVLEGRLAGHMCARAGVPAFKVWIDAPVEVRASRIAEREGKDAARVLEEMRAREECERSRYKMIYGIDFGETSVYDSILDSRTRTAEELADEVVGEVRRRA